MKASALITNFNYGGFIEAAIRSTLGQTAPPAEVIVVDDGSQDNSRDVISRLSIEFGERVVPVFQTNAGQAGAINTGFARCSGDIVCMLDADDRWDPTKIEKVMAAFVAEPDAGMVMHRYRLIDRQGRTVEEDVTGGMARGDLAGLVLSTGGAWVFGATSSLSFRRSVLDQILPAPAGRWRLCADGALAYPAAFLGTVVALDEVLGSYRVHGTNNHYAAGLDADKVQADVEMTNRYLNDFLARIGRTERVDLLRNLHYRRERFYLHGGSPTEAAAVARLILGWPLYHGPIERFKFLTRFVMRAARQRWCKSLKALPSEARRAILGPR